MTSRVRLIRRRGGRLNGARANGSVVYRRQLHECARARLRFCAAVAEGTGSEATAKWAGRSTARTESDVIRAHHARAEKRRVGAGDSELECFAIARTTRSARRDGNDAAGGLGKAGPRCAHARGRKGEVFADEAGAAVAEAAVRRDAEICRITAEWCDQSQSQHHVGCLETNHEVSPGRVPWSGSGSVVAVRSFLDATMPRGQLHPDCSEGQTQFPVSFVAKIQLPVVVFVT